MKKKPTKEPYNPRVDRDALHRFLWERANRYHRIKIHQQRLAEALDLTRGTVTRIIGEMSREGRLKKVEALPDNIGVYLIADPDTWKPKGEKVEPARKSRELKWS